MDMNYRRTEKKEEKPIDLLIDHMNIRDIEIQEKGIPNNMNGLEVTGLVQVPGKGYVFYGKHNVQIGQFKYINSTGKYEVLLNPDAKELIKKGDIKEKRLAQQRKFKLQRRNKAIAIGLSGLILITSLSYGLHEAISRAHAEQTNITVTVPTTNLTEMPDAVKISWANYAMGVMTERAERSEYEAVKNQVENLYQSYFAPTCSSYYDYCELASSPLDKELTSDYTERLHNEFDRNLAAFEERLEVVSFGSSLLINNTPYANAKVLDESPNPDAIVYLPLMSLPEDSPYSVTNLPEGSQIIDGQIYVPEYTLHEKITHSK